MRLLTLFILFFISFTASAHTGHATQGFISGFLHPILGLDHFIAMFAIGLWASQYANKTSWLIPISFIATMVIAGALAILFPTLSIPFTESMILSSVLVLGLILIFSLHISLFSALPLVMLFSFFHGIAHGQEAPTATHPVLYVVGFMIATMGLIGLGKLLGQSLEKSMIRFAGAAVLLTGIWLFI